MPISTLQAINQQITRQFNAFSNLYWLMQFDEFIFCVYDSIAFSQHETCVPLPWTSFFLLVNFSYEVEFTAEVILPGKLAHIIIIILFLIIIRSSQCKTKTSSVEKKKNVY